MNDWKIIERATKAKQSSKATALGAKAIQKELSLFDEVD